MRDLFAAHDAVDAPDHLLDGAEAERGHDAAQLLGDEEHVVHDVLGRAREARAQHRVLRRDADGTRVEVALAHHDAAARDERRGREAELLGAEERRERDVAARLELAVDLEGDARAQVVEEQDLLRLGEAELPRRAGVLDRRDGARARAAVVAGDEDDVGVRLRDARGDGAHARLAHELHADARARIDVLQIEDELREVLDRIDVVVRRRRDERHALRRVADARDDGVDLVAGELAALAGLRALRHLDLDLVGVDEVVRRDAEAPARDLLDRGASRVAARIDQEARLVLAALAGVAAAADAVHRDGEVLVRLLRDAAEAHRAGGEAVHDRARLLDLGERHGRTGRLRGRAGRAASRGARPGR